MQSYDKYLLNTLLNSYEKSLLSKGTNKIAVRIPFTFNKKTIPEYFDESSLAYETIHECVRELEAKDFIVVVWKKKKINHIVEKIILQEDNIHHIYDYLKRTPKQIKEFEVLSLLDEMKKIYKTPIVKGFIEYLENRIKQDKSVKEYIDMDDMDSFRQLIKAVHSIENNDETYYILEFSIHNFGDSKIFEGMIHTVGKIFKKFDSRYENMEVYEILSEFSIYHTPDYVYLKGDCVIHWGNNDSTGTDLRLVKQGLGVSGTDLKEIKVLPVKSTKKVITIENLTTFFRWEEPDSIIIYLGGYHNTVRRKLLETIYKVMPTALYLHFGDIDIGGFEIYEDLCRKTGIHFKPYYMDSETLNKYRDFAKPLSLNDQKRLDALIEKQQKDCEYVEVLIQMKKHGIKLEQECIRR